ncbi:MULTISPECIES: hypothetical protein [Calothrix]|uniref:TonB C-terminal domain-containing protein n=2 Tax=Calothrix TaxID=1186 RepID=A0ABR8AI78_9CYAN|nr:MULTISPECIES: hypothetical protein [Calothrix]MBD2198262.1 hypothetical protein [Calothrix parietina FACHB-288]MBD2226585.1 hypothetical protein [Calothrix anomala FACHB-343]
MSYVSLLRNLPEVLSQPTGIAAIASVGIHGAIALIVPLVPVDSNKTKEVASSKPIGMMELSQADQKRLPEIPGTSTTLPPSPVQLQQSQIPQLNFGGQTNLSALPPAPPAPNPSQMMLEPIPSSPTNYPISPLPKQQSLRTYSKKDLGLDTSDLNTRNKFSSSIARYSSKDIALGQSQPLVRSGLPVFPAGKLPAGLPTSPAPLPINSMPGTPGDTINTAQNTPTGDNTASGSQNGQLLAGINTTTPSGNNLATATTGVGSNTSTSGTEKAIAQIKSYEDLRKTVQQQYPTAVEKSVIRDSITTDKPDVQGLVLGRLVVGPEGVLDIKFEDSSNRALQVKAQEYFKANPPQRDRQIAHYPFSLEFKNSNNTASGNTQQPASADTIKPLSTPALNNNQPVPATGISPKPVLNLPVNNNQPAPATGSSPKPVLNLPVNNNQPAPATGTSPKPVLNLPVNNNQPAPAPETTGKPQSNSLINRIKPVAAPTVTASPFPNLVNTIKPVATPAATVKPSPAPENNTSQPAPTVEPGKKLIQQLRQLREERETSSK